MEELNNQRNDNSDVEYFNLTSFYSDKPSITTKLSDRSTVRSHYMSHNGKEIKSKILFVKSKKDKGNDDLTVDAINHYVSNLDSCKHLRFVNYFYIDNDEEFIVNDKIYCRAQKLIMNEKEDISYSLELYSYELQLQNLNEQQLIEYSKI